MPKIPTKEPKARRRIPFNARSWPKRTWTPSPAPTASPPREREILGLISKGRDVPYIEQELVLSKSTVKTHIRHIYEKCKVSSRQALIDLLQSHPGD